MRGNNSQSPEKKEILRGNRTKTDPQKDTTGIYVTNAVTRFNQNKNGPPTVKDNDTELARIFAQENKK